MPPTTYHVAIAGLLAIALLGRYFDWRAFLVVAAATAFPDLDGVVEIYWFGAHRTLFHNVFLPLLVAVALAWDLYLRDTSYIRTRWGERGERVAWTSVVCIAVAAVAVDMFHNGVNLLWPLHDQMYEIQGTVTYSTEDGVSLAGLLPEAVGTTEEVHLRTPVDMTPGDDPAGVERVAVFAEDGQQTLLTIVGLAAVALRLVWNPDGYQEPEPTSASEMR